MRFLLVVSVHHPSNKQILKLRVPPPQRLFSQRLLVEDVLECRDQRGANRAAEAASREHVQDGVERALYVDQKQRHVRRADRSFFDLLPVGPFVRKGPQKAAGEVRHPAGEEEEHGEEEHAIETAQTVARVTRPR